MLILLSFSAIEVAKRAAILDNSTSRSVRAHTMRFQNSLLGDKKHMWMYNLPIMVQFGLLIQAFYKFTYGNLPYFFCLLKGHYSIVIFILKIKILEHMAGSLKNVTTISKVAFLKLPQQCAGYYLV